MFQRQHSNQLLVVTWVNHYWYDKALTHFGVGSGEFGTILKTILPHALFLNIIAASGWVLCPHEDTSVFHLPHPKPWYATTLRCIVNGKHTASLFARGPRPTSADTAAFREVSKYTKVLANFMKENPSREDNSTLINKFPAFFCGTRNFKSHHTKQLVTWPYPEPDYLVYTCPLYLFKIHFNIIFTSTPALTKFKTDKHGTQPQCRILSSRGWVEV